MRRNVSRIVLASLLGLVLVVLWRLVADGIKPSPSGRVSPLESVSAEPLASAVSLQGIGQVMAEGAKELEQLGISLQGVGPASLAPDSPVDRADVGLRAHHDLFRILATNPMRLKSGANGEISIIDTDINPRGLLVPEATMTVFRAWEDVYVDGLALMVTGANQLRVEEMTALAKSGVLRPLKYTSDPVVLAEMEESRALSRPYGGGEPGFFGASYYEGAEGLAYFVKVGSSTYGAAEADLPQYSAIMDLRRECVRQAYMQAATIAHASGLLDESQFKERVERARRRKV